MLPANWITRIFERMEGLYGARFHDAWKGTNLDNVKLTWAEKLAGFAGKPEAIKSALDALDDKPFPPTLPEFMLLCREASRHERAVIQPALPAPEIPKAEIEARIATVEKVLHKGGGYDFKGWAKKLRAEYLSGVCLYPIQIAMASEALGEKWEGGKCLPRQEAA